MALESSWVTYDGRMTNVLVITSNPDPGSLTDTAGDVFAQGARSAGADVDVLDLYDAGFNPVYTLADRRHYLGRGPVPRDVASIQDRLEKADVIAIIFPVYWYTMPAMVKGLFDRVICRGFAYNLSGEPGALAGKAMRIVMLTGGSQGWYESDGIGEALDNQIVHQTLKKYCGVTDARIVYIDNLVSGDDDPERREGVSEQLERLRVMGESLAGR